MKFFKFLNKKGADGVLPEHTINKILANPKKAKTIEVLYECDKDGNKIPDEVNPEVSTGKVGEQENEAHEKPKEPAPTPEPYLPANKWGGDESSRRKASDPDIGTYVYAT